MGRRRPVEAPMGVVPRYRASYRKCGKPTCSTCQGGPGHGPYWYAHWRDGRSVRSRYIGKRPPSAEPAQDIRVETLGHLLVSPANGVPQTLLGRPREVFTTLLSAPYGSVGREEIAEALWPEHDSLAADRNLRVTVATLRRKLGQSTFIRVNGPSVSLAIPTEWRDDCVFEAAGREALAAGQLEAIKRAIDLCRGAYLPDDIYSDWTTFRRQVLADLFRILVIRAIELRPDPQLAVEWLRGILVRDGCDEEAAVLLIGLLAESGRRSEALRVFRSLRSALKLELEVEPGEMVLRAVQELGP